MSILQIKVNYMYNLKHIINNNNGDNNMDNIDVRTYIINNFKEDDIKDIENSITESIDSKEDDTLIGLGVLFEIMWNNSDNTLRNSILLNIKKGLDSKVNNK